ncbi:uncharacterized protein LOC131268823 [Anopheles coustani]|uniref:uncharacterized protein LOC131268823 n=1 Tax=Anopheles coustani TaxID=139045 RepID=UPI00265A0573|nr:uncharacterized protein LOC131268823 [Anopheles coustani]
MSASSTTSIIPEDSSAEQEKGNLKERGNSTLKENMQHGSFPANTRELLKGFLEPMWLKISSKSTQTVSQAEVDITAEDPCQDYWLSLAEHRRIALEQTLAENAGLHITACELQSQVEKNNVLKRELQNVNDTLMDLLGDDIMDPTRGEWDPVDDSGVVQGNDSCMEY